MGNTEPPRGNYDAVAIATALRVALARKNTTQSVLAKHLNLSQPAVHRRMAGKVSWRISELSKAADFLDVSLAELLSDAAAEGVAS